MKRSETAKVTARIFFASICLVLMAMAPAAKAITKANFDKVKATFQWENAATPVPGLNCDDCAQQINIGFSFPFAGEKFDKVWVSSNGLLSLIDKVTDYSNKSLPITGRRALIMPYWDNLHPGRGGSVTYNILGSAPNRRLVVSWNDVPHYPNSGEYNFQVILYETGEIKFQYGKGNANGSSATVGIEVAYDDYIQHVYNQNVIKPKDAWLFRPQPYVQSVIQPCGSLNSLIVRYSYPMDAGSAGRKQNYDFVSSPTPGLNVSSASLSPDGYTVTLALNKSLQAGSPYQLRIKDALSFAGRTMNPNPTTRPISGSSGLIGTYYSQYGIQQAYHTGPWVQRNDAQVDFSWGNAVPDILPRGDDFSVRWKGYLIPTRTGSYVFRTYSDDGIRLWINGTKILDAWNDHSSRYDKSSVVNLSAGEAVPIVLEHYERSGRAFARLYWDDPDGTSGNYALIPSSALSPCLPLPGPDHIRIEHDGNGLTCQAERITLKACADTACNTEYAGDVTVNLVANNGGTWSANPVTFKGHTDVHLSKTTPGDTTLSIASATPPAVNDWDCVVNGALVSQTDCKVNFADAGFVFDVPDLTACETSPDVTLRAVKKNDGNTSCAPAFTGDRTVQFWSTYVNPDSGPQAISINGDPVAVASPGTPILLNFNDRGEAKFTVSYPDVGRMKLDVRYDGSLATNDAGLVMTGSDQFVARPHHFDLTAIQCADGTANPGASDASGARFCKAGQDFQVEVKAVCADGSTTPNFGSESPAESVKLTSALVAPAGGAPGALSGGMASFGTNCKGKSAPGVACGTFQWSEVGIINLTPSILDGDYLDTGDVSGVTIGNVGRFYPDHFQITKGTVTPACSNAFTYFDQDGLITEFQIEVMNSNSQVTRNYEGDFAKLNLADWNKYHFSADGLPDGSTLVAGGTSPTAQWKEGVGKTQNFTGGWDNEVKIMHQVTRPSALSGETLVLVKAKPVDEDEVTVVNAQEVSDATPLRFGRLVLDSANGSEFVNLSMPVRTEYYDGTEWRINSDDSCTTVNASDLTEEDVDSSDTLRPEDVTPSGGGQLSAGHTSFTLSAPGVGHTGSLKFSLTAPSWLQVDWKNNGSFDENPSALATFGVYQGNPSIIYQREVWAQ